MKKSLLFALSLLLVSCGSSGSSLSRITRSSSEPAASSEPTMSSPVASSEGEGSAVSEASSIESSSEAFIAPTTEDFVPRYLQKVSEYKSYKAVTKGSTKASVLFVSYDQSIDVTLIKSEYTYLKNESHSDLVNTVHEAYFHQDNVAYHDNGGEYAVSTLDEYLDKYGVYPLDPAIEGYLCNEDCITSVESLESTDGYAFKITFDNEKATNNVRIQMKAFGNLDDYPVFSSIVINVYVKEDMTPDHLEVAADYKAKMFIETDCHQEYRVDFSDFNQDIEIPELDTMKSDHNF